MANTEKKGTKNEIYSLILERICDMKSPIF